MCRSILAALSVLILSGPCRAAPPTLTQLFPPGGQRGQTTTVAASGSFSSWPVKGWCAAKGATVTATKETGKFTVAIAADTIPGTYWVRLFNDEGASELRPFFVSNLSEVIEQEPNDDFKKPHVLPSSSVVVNGKLEKSGDVDGFAVQCRQGQTLVASLEAQETLRSPMDGVLQVVSEGGFVLAQNDDFRDMDPQIAYVVPKDGVYVVRVFAFPSVADSSIRFAGGDKFLYRLTLTTGGFADHAFPLAVTRSDSTPVQIVGWNLADAARHAVLQPTGPLSASVFHPLVANAVAVRVEPHATVSKRKPADRTQPQSVVLPATISGKLETRDDIDVYQFPVKKGDKLQFQVEARSLHFPLDAILRLTDDQGKTLAESRAGKLNTDPTLDFTVSDDGAHRIELRDLHGDGGPRFLYRLRATRAEPDFDLTLAADRFTVAAGKSLSIPVTVNRRNGFAKELTFRVEGLPPGAELEPAPVSATGKTATLTLKANSTTASVPLRIMAQTKDGLLRVAEAKGAEQKKGKGGNAKGKEGEPSWTSAWCWLTVTGK